MSLAEMAHGEGLHRVGARPPLLTYVRQAWDRRAFPYTLALARIEARDQKNRLGMLWVVLRPALNAAIYGLIFGVLQGGRRPPDFPAYVVIGVFLWEFFSSSLSAGAKAISGNVALVQSLAFPRIALPLAVVIEHFLNLLPMLVVMGGALLILGQPISATWLLILPLLVLFTLFNIGVALIAARVTVHIQDFTQLLPYITRILFYTSGVLFSVDRLFVGHPTVKRLFDFHPVYEVISIARGAFMSDHALHMSYWLYLTVWAVVTFALGIVFFWSAEERYGRVQ